MITHKQLTLAEVFENCQNKFDNDKYQFLSLLDEAINLDEIVPVSFVFHFHARTGRPRKHQLYPMLKALLLQRILCMINKLYPSSTSYSNNTSCSFRLFLHIFLPSLCSPFYILVFLSVRYVLYYIHIFPICQLCFIVFICFYFCTILT